MTVLAGGSLVRCGVLDISEVDLLLASRVGAVAGDLDRVVLRLEDARALLDVGILRCAAPAIGDRRYDLSLRPAQGMASASMDRASALVLDWLSIRLLSRLMAKRASVAAALSPVPFDAACEVGARVLKRARLGLMSLDPDFAVSAAEAMIQEGRAALATARGRRAKIERSRVRVKGKRPAPTR